MGIKDNFSQAVKELWKKDGQEERGGGSDASQPTALEQYLRQQDAAAEQTAQQDAAQPYAGQPGQPVQQGQPVQSQPTQPAQSVQQSAQPGAAAQPAAQPAQQPQPAQQAQSAQQSAQSFRPTGEANAAGVPLETPYYRAASAPQAPNPAGYRQSGYGAAQGGSNGAGGSGGFGGGFVPPTENDASMRSAGETDEVTVISKNTVIDGNVRSLANMRIDGNIQGNIETTRNIDMSGKVVGDITCNNAGMSAAAMQGNVSLKGRMQMDRDTILIGDLTSQYADINGRIRGKLDIAGKAELKRDAIVFGDINASTIAVTDGAIIQGYVNTTFLSKEDSKNAIPDAITIDSKSGVE